MAENQTVMIVKAIYRITTIDNCLVASLKTPDKRDLTKHRTNVKHIRKIACTHY